MKIVTEVRLPTHANMEMAAKLLKADEILAFPTETVYGLGANALSDEAVAKIFKAKARPSNNPLIVHIPSADHIDTIADLSDATVRARFQRLTFLWPGPLSLVLPAKSTVSKLVTAGGNTVAVRVPAHPIAQNLLRLCELPIAAPSANQAGYVSPTTARHVLESLRGRIGIIIDGGPSDIGLESTVVSLVGARPTLLRPGAVTHAELERILSEKVDRLTPRESAPAATPDGGAKPGENAVEQAALPAQSDAPVQSPGLTSQHYAPRTPIALLSPELLLSLKDTSTHVALKRVGLITLNRHPELLGLPNLTVRALSKFGDLHQAATNLFAVIRELDQLNLEKILVEACDDIGIGEAIMDRIRRASASLPSKETSKTNSNRKS